MDSGCWVLGAGAECFLLGPAPLWEKRDLVRVARDVRASEAPLRTKCQAQHDPKPWSPAARNFSEETLSLHFKSPNSGPSNSGPNSPSR